MAFYFTAYLTNNGAPATGLTPTIDVYDLSDNSKVVNAQAMTEVGGGLYSYEYSTYDASKNYAGIVDGGATLANSERYIPVSSGLNPLGEAVEGSITLKQVAMLFLSIFAAVRSGMGGLNTSFRDQADTKDRLKVVMDSNGNITSVTMDFT